MSGPPDFPTSPDQLRAWVEALSSDEVMRLAESIGDDAVTGSPATPDFAFVERDNPPIELPDPPDEPVLLTVHLELDGTAPPVWRRLTIPGDLDLGRLHDVLQAAMGWTDSHLHRFCPGEKTYDTPYFVTDFDLSEGDEGTLEADARLDQVLREPGDTLTYEYDFGDGWMHTLRLESTDPLPDPPDAEASEAAEAGSAAYPLVCLAGEGACPPEDVGGIYGYEDVAGWLRAGGSDDHEFDNGLTADEMRRWLPDGWHPDEFDRDEVNAALARLAPRDTDVALGELPPELIELIEALPTTARFDVDDWLSAPGWDEQVTFTPELATTLTTPVRLVLEAVGDGLDLTAAGYLPPRVVQSIFEALGLDGEWFGKGNREDQTRPVAVLRDEVRRMGLIRKSKGRLLPTTLGRRLRDDPVWLLDHVLTRLGTPGPDFDRIATRLSLLAIAGGVPAGIVRAEWRDQGVLAEAVCRVLAFAGWLHAGGGWAQRGDVIRATMEPLTVLRQMLRCVEDPTARETVARDVARASLQRMD